MGTILYFSQVFLVKIKCGNSCKAKLFWAWHIVNMYVSYETLCIIFSKEKMRRSLKVIIDIAGGYLRLGLDHGNKMNITVNCLK